MDENRRNFSRVKFNSVAYLKYQEKQQKVELIDISLKGALITAAENDLTIQKGDPCVFEFRLSDSEIVLSINSLVVYIHDSNLGLKFENIELESMIHLRRLVELNVGNPDQIQKELFFLVTPNK